MGYRAAVVGCGRIGSELADDPLLSGVYSHAQAYSLCPGVALVALCDRDPVKLDRCGDRWGVGPRYGDLRQMLVEQQPEIVSICTPDRTHFALARETILSPGVRAVLVEKPLAMEAAEGQVLVRLAQEQGVLLAVNYSRRFADSHLRLKRFIGEGGIGQIQTVAGFYTKGIFHNGTHWVDLARFLVGEVVRVWGFNNRGQNGDDPTLDAVLEFDVGVKGHLQGCDDGAFGLFEMDLIGTAGRVRIADYGQVLETFSVTDSPYYSGYKSLVRVPGLEGGLSDAMLGAVEDLVRCLDHQCQPRCSGWDGVTALRVAEAVCQAARSGYPVTIAQGGYA